MNSHTSDDFACKELAVIIVSLKSYIKDDYARPGRAVAPLAPPPPPPPPPRIPLATAAFGIAPPCITIVYYSDDIQHGYILFYVPIAT